MGKRDKSSCYTAVKGHTSRNYDPYQMLRRHKNNDNYYHGIAKIKEMSRSLLYDKHVPHNVTMGYEKGYTSFLWT